MARINAGKVVVGGLVATVVMAVSSVGMLLVVGDQMTVAGEALGARELNAAVMVGYLAVGLATGILAVWVYAAIRPRFGPGPRTALLAGLVVWALRPGLAIAVFLLMGLMPTGLLLTELVWQLVRIPLATVVGARFYSESESA